MLKWLGIGLVICGSGAMGASLSMELQRRVEQLKELRKMGVLLEGEIRYGNATLNEAFRHTASRVRPPFREFLEQTAGQMEGFRGEGLAEIFRQNIERELGKSSLKKEDKELLNRLGESMGYLDIKMQMDSLSLFLSQLNISCEEALKDQRNNAKVFRYLGVMGGLFLAIIFI